MNLIILPDLFAICRLGPAEDVPDWAMIGELVSITHTADELSIVCAEENMPPEVRAERGWRALRVEGPLDLALTGVLASLAQPLAESQISLFAISTFDTDYLLVKGYNLSRACEALRQAGQHVRNLE